ncbi:hypothetical protein V6N13_006042 [Hibiscus sabdariffa]
MMAQNTVDGGSHGSSGVSMPQTKTNKSHSHLNHLGDGGGGGAMRTKGALRGSGPVSEHMMAEEDVLEVGLCS